MQITTPNYNFSYAISDLLFSHREFFGHEYYLLLEELKMIAESKSNFIGEYYLNSVLFPLIDKFLSPEVCDIFSKPEQKLSKSEKDIKSCLINLAEAFLQTNKKHYPESYVNSLRAFQQIVNAVFDKISNEVSTTAPPLVIWNTKKASPHTYTAQKIKKTLDINVGLVCLPYVCENHGLLAWSVMGHEVAGHNFIQGKKNLLKELQKIVDKRLDPKLQKRLGDSKINFNKQDISYLTSYWSQRKRVEEAACDVFGVLTTGPSLAIGCIGYFRGMSKMDISTDGQLRFSGPFKSQKKTEIVEISISDVNIKIKDLSKAVDFKYPEGVLGKDLTSDNDVNYKIHKILSDPHPIPLLRLIMMIEAIKFCTFSINGKQNTDSKNTKDFWVKSLEKELEKDLSQIKSIEIIEISTEEFPPKEIKKEIPIKIACLSAKIIGELLANTSIKCLGNRKISDIFNWSMEDELHVENVRDSFRKDEDSVPPEVSAIHIVSAGIMEATSPKLKYDILELFQKMKRYLVKNSIMMGQRNLISQ